ncbi:hypothetical protein [Actinomadura rugatobispora]|uniref:Uncharacterized protein n=1 Tax=Actinomadura rugatobispora TaxID=1994 RepID=A0ABW0ZQ27_9ACTN|nr:hypothetical protein GCM10010200_023800 [Actinomadura rugatobispora]
MAARPYTYLDLADWEDPGDARASRNWLEETIMLVDYRRTRLSELSRTAVDCFGDGAATGEYRHFVPWSWMVRRIAETVTTTDMTGADTVDWLRARMRGLGIADLGALDPRADRTAFDTWFSWTVDQLCDWPRNVYRWPLSTGHAGGTALDLPLDLPGGPIVPTALKMRLLDARRSLITWLDVPSTV